MLISPSEVSISPESHPPFPLLLLIVVRMKDVQVSISPESHPPFPRQKLGMVSLMIRHVSISPESHPPFPLTVCVRLLYIVLVSISPESHPPFPLAAEFDTELGLSVFQSRLSPIHPFHTTRHMTGACAKVFQSRLSPIHPFHGYA